MVDQTDFETTTDESGRSGRVLTRRNVLKTTAWTVPAVAVVTSAPAFAISPPVPTFTVTNLGSYRGASATDTTATTNAGAFAFVQFRVSVPASSPAPLEGCKLTISPAAGANGLRFDATDSVLGIFAKTAPTGTTTSNNAPFVFDAGATPVAIGTSQDLKVVFDNNTYAAADTPASLVFTGTNTSATVSFTGYSGNLTGFNNNGGVYDILNPPHS